MPVVSNPLHPTFITVEVFLGFAAAVITLYAAIPKISPPSFYEVCSRHWQTVETSPWLVIPDVVLRMLVRRWRAERIFGGLFEPLHTLGLIDVSLTPSILAVGMYVMHREWAVPISSPIMILLVSLQVLIGLSYGVIIWNNYFGRKSEFVNDDREVECKNEDDERVGQGVHTPRYVLLPVFIAGVLLPIPICYVWLRIALHSKPISAVLIEVVMAIFVSTVIVVADVMLTTGYIESLRLGLSVATIPISFAVTFYAMSLGHRFAPQEWSPQTFQMLISNVVFDFLTVFFAIGILQVSVFEEGWPRFSVPFAIFLIVCVSLLFAFLSIWCGLLRTDHALGFRQIVLVLFGRSLEGTRFELGPIFWVAHTTFFPIVGFLGLVTFVWTAKIVSGPTRWIVRWRSGANPVGMTAAFLYFILATVALIDHWLS